MGGIYGTRANWTLRDGRGRGISDLICKTCERQLSAGQLVSYEGQVTQKEPAMSLREEPASEGSNQNMKMDKTNQQSRPLTSALGRADTAADITTKMHTPLAARCIQLPVLDRSILDLPVFIPSYMGWAEESQINLGLAILEALRLLLGDDSSQLLLLGDVASKAAMLLDRSAELADGDAFNTFTYLWISDLCIFPMNFYAVECTPRRVVAAIQRCRERARAYPQAAPFLDVMGTTEYLDRCISPELWAGEHYRHPIGQP